MDDLERKDRFFIGWRALNPWRAVLPALAIAIGAAAAFAAAGFTQAYFTDAQTSPVFTPDTSISGIYQADPYPMLRAAADKDHPEGRTVLLAGFGKQGAQKDMENFSGKAANVSGFYIKRGSIDMLIYDNAKAADDVPSDAASPAKPEGRWRIGGEICDGKCTAGAMTPGKGLAHKGCANLCISGGLPPLLVTEMPVKGSNFLLLADEKGGPLASGTWERLVARPVILEGEVESRGDLLVLKTDVTKSQFP